MDRVIYERKKSNWTEPTSDFTAPGTPRFFQAGYQLRTLCLYIYTYMYLCVCVRVWLSLAQAIRSERGEKGKVNRVNHARTVVIGEHKIVECCTEIRSFASLVTQTITGDMGSWCKRSIVGGERISAVSESLWNPRKTGIKGAIV